MRSGHYDNLDICFTGGEPLLSYRHIRNIVKTLNSEYASLDIKYSIITNGTLLNKSIITFLSNNKFTVQISLSITPIYLPRFCCCFSQGKNLYKPTAKN